MPSLPSTGAISKPHEESWHKLDREELRRLATSNKARFLSAQPENGRRA